MSTTPRHPVGQERRYHLQRMAASLAVAAIGMLPALGHGASQPGTFPERMIQLTVPFPAGAATHYAASTVGQRLATILGVPVVVDNKIGVRTPAEHLAFIEQETQRWKPVVEQADLQR